MSAVVVKDSKAKAILFMNLMALGAVGQNIFFKLAASKGAQVSDYQVLRNASIFVVASLQLACSRINPIKAFPWSDKKWVLFWRCVAGQLVFFLFNICLTLVPLTLQQIVFQTGTFWTSILAFCVFGERLIALELVSMTICFIGMIVITISGSKQADELDGNAEEVNYSSK